DELHALESNPSARAPLTRRGRRSILIRGGGIVVETVSVRMSFPGGRKVLARVGEHTVLTDQPRARGGEDEAPSPYRLFLASIGACVGYYALVFCQSRDISCEGLEVYGDFQTENGTLVGAE